MVYIMALDNIKRYLKRSNEFAELFLAPPIELATLTTHQYNYLQEHIEYELSPENLTNDGELPYNEVHFRAKHFEAALKELHDFAIHHNFGAH